MKKLTARQVKLVENTSSWNYDDGTPESGPPIEYFPTVSKAKKLTYEEAMEYAMAHYRKGGDTFYECTERSEYQPMTKSELLREFRTSKEQEDDMFGTR